MECAWEMLRAYWQEYNTDHIGSVLDHNMLFLWDGTYLSFRVFRSVQGLMSVHNCVSQMMNVCFPPPASTGLHISSRTTPLTSLISTFIFPPPSLQIHSAAIEPDDCSGQWSGLMHVLHIQQNINSHSQMSGGDRHNKQPTTLAEIYPTEKHPSSHPCLNQNFSSTFDCMQHHY